MSQVALKGRTRSGLARVVRLAGVVGIAGALAATATAGCSSSSTGGASDPGRDAATIDIDSSVEQAERACPHTEPIDATKLSWKPPSVLHGSCTDKELEELVAYVNGHPAAKYVDWKGAVTNAGCSSCVFGKDTDATWKPLVEDANGQLVGLYVGGCIALASGSEACGHSYQNWFDCRFQACADCPNGDTAALQKCLSAASKSACKKAFDDVGTVCTDRGITDAETTCDGMKFVFEGPIRAQCIGLPEGGE
ncbi:MAG: hypothetical protein JWP87_2346 [Labilithrix sp.]|nr:hypothetical protein [Labilithrix sp.]